MFFFAFRLQQPTYPNLAWYLQDYAAATALLEPLAAQQNQQEAKSTNNDLRSALGRVYLQAGQLDKAEAHFAAIANTNTNTDEEDEAGTDTPETTKTLNAAFLASARGDWDTASRLLRGLVEQDEANYAVRPLFQFFVP